MLTTPQAALCKVIAKRADELRADLAAHVAIPTGHNHTAGLNEYRDIVTSRLENLGAHTEFVAGDPAPGWLSSSGLSDEPIPPTAVCRSARAAELLRTREEPEEPEEAPSGGAGRRGSRSGVAGRIGPEAGRRGDGPALVLIAGHLDTVFPPTGRFRRMEVSADGRTAVGPGVVDMKGGILVAIAALEALAEVGIAPAWSFLLNSDEERGSFHSHRALEAEARRHTVGLALEPALPGGELAIERKGSGQFCIEVTGRSSHAGRAFFEGLSAVYGLGRVLGELEKLSDSERGVTVNVGPIEGGTATNAVPDRAAAWGNVRYPDEASAARLGERLDALARDVDGSSAGGTGAGAGVRVLRSFNRPAKPRTPGSDGLARSAQQVAELLGQRLPLASTGGVCDGNILQSAGLPTIDTLGVRGGGLHTEEEWIELPSLVERAQLLACLLARLAEEGAWSVGGGGGGNEGRGGGGVGR